MGERGELTPKSVVSQRCRRRFLRSSYRQAHERRTSRTLLTLQHSFFHSSAQRKLSFFSLVLFGEFESNELNSVKLAGLQLYSNVGQTASGRSLNTRRHDRRVQRVVSPSVPKRRSCETRSSRPSTISSPTPQEAREAIRWRCKYVELECWIGIGREWVG